MILQTGFRTDIPAFYSEWFANRLRAGYVLVRNPYNPQAVTRYELNPDMVDLIGFCTKNPAPMLQKMDLLRSYGQYWFVTITPYGPEIEPHVPPKKTVLCDFVALSEIVGPDSIGWRYDPIFLSDTYTVERHIQEFTRMAAVLAGHTHTCVISFIDLYEKVRRNFPQVQGVSRADRLTLGKAFVEIGRQYGLTIRPCAEGDELAPYGADCSGCMTQQIFETALHRRLHLPVSLLRQPLAHDGIVKYHGSKNVRDLFHLAWSPFRISNQYQQQKTALVPGDLVLSTTPLPFQCSKIYACCGKMSSGKNAISFGGFHRFFGKIARFFILDTCKCRGVLYTWILIGKILRAVFAAAGISSYGNFSRTLTFHDDLGESAPYRHRKRLFCFSAPTSDSR